jgi:hypothetical protein
MHKLNIAALNELNEMLPKFVKIIIDGQIKYLLEDRGILFREAKFTRDYV